jgi:type IV secretory pathway TrbF-like protein
MRKLAMIISGMVIVGAMASGVAYNAAQSRSQAVSVSTWNDGYATAMRDACQDERDAYACQWLNDNNGGK